MVLYLYLGTLALSTSIFLSINVFLAEPFKKKKNKEKQKIKGEIGNLYFGLILPLTNLILIGTIIHSIINIYKKKDLIIKEKKLELTKNKASTVKKENIISKPFLLPQKREDKPKVLIKTKRKKHNLLLFISLLLIFKKISNKF